MIYYARVNVSVDRVNTVSLTCKDINRFSEILSRDICSIHCGIGKVINFSLLRYCVLELI